MPRVLIEDSLNSKDYKWFKKKLLLNKSDFNVSKLPKIIENIENRGDRQIIYYVFYRIITENKIDPLINPTPKNGLLFSDLKTKKSLGIYHCHLFGDMVLIWFVTKDTNDNLNLEIEYIKHPGDNYKTILKQIYKNPNGWNLYSKKYFKDYFNSTYLKENFIQKWFSFMRSF